MRIDFLLVIILFFAAITPSDARDASQVYAFRADHPCPSTGALRGACPGWVVDHLQPLCAGGQDAPSNMQWQPRKQAKAKDKIEIAYCRCMAKAIAACIVKQSEK